MYLRSARVFSLLSLATLLFSLVSPSNAAPPMIAKTNYAQVEDPVQSAAGIMIMPNDRFVHEPNFTSLEIQTFLNKQPGILKQYTATLDNSRTSAARIIDASSFGMAYDVNPKVVLTLLELKTHLITKQNPLPNELDHPFGYNGASTKGFQSELFWMTWVMQRAYMRYSSEQYRQIELANGTKLKLNTSPNAGTFALQTAIGLMSASSNEFIKLIGQDTGSFVATYQKFFEDPRVPRTQVTVATTPFLYKPFVGSYAVGSFFDHDAREGALRRFDGVLQFSYDDHQGDDYPMDPGIAIIAAANGTVADVAINRTEGIPSQWCTRSYTPVTGMIIRHTIGGVEFRTTYWHLTSGRIATNPRTGRQFAAGDSILRGEILGYSGSTGCVTGPHLHFQVQRAGISTDPYGWCGAGADPWLVPNEMLWAEVMTNPSPCRLNTNQPPNIPVPTGPINGGTINNRNVIFSWQDAGDPDNSPRTYRDYYAEIWKTDNSWRQALSWTTATNWTIAVPSDGQYAWHVKASDGALGSDWSSTWNFYVDTNRPPNNPQQISPGDGSFVNSRSLALQWQDAGDPDNGPRTYRDYYAEIWKTDSSWQQTLSWTTATNWSVVVPSDGTYQWRVRAGDGAAGSTWSGPWHVVIDTSVPGGSVSINNGLETSDGLYAPITLNANDIGSGVREVRLSNNGLAWDTWQPMINQVWRLLNGEHRGTATIYVQYRDAAGNISSPASDSIGLNFYPSQPSSSRYRVVQDVVAMNGGVRQSEQYRMNGTSGQSLASGDVATSSRYQATLGYWNGYASDQLPPSVDPDRPSSSHYRLPKAVIAMNGGSKQSAHYQIHGTSGQPLASSSFANSPRYKAGLGFWP